jgi:alpha/beta superfamily hydrolase
MQMPAMLQGESLTRLSQGAFAGFIATVVIGFSWGGWTLGSTAKEHAVKSAAAAVVTVLAPICADKFRQAADAPANMTELKKTNSWQQDTYIEKGGWATFPGMTAPDRNVAQACATMLTALQ